MNLLIESKLCVTPHRITIDDLPESEGEMRVFTVVFDDDDRVTVQTRRRSRRSYRSAPPADTDEPRLLPFSQN